MAFSLYDASVANYLQTLGAVGGFLERGLTYFSEQNIDPETIVEARLAPDMLPLRFQIISVAQHSRGAIEGVQSGEFRPPSFKTPYDYAGLQGLVAQTQRGVVGLDAGGRQCTRRPRRRLQSRRTQAAFHGGRLSDVVLAAQFLFPRHHRLRHPAYQRGSLGQAGLYGPAQDEEMSAALRWLRKIRLAQFILPSA